MMTMNRPAMAKLLFTSNPQEEKKFKDEVETLFNKVVKESPYLCNELRTQTIKASPEYKREYRKQWKLDNLDKIAKYRSYHKTKRLVK